MNREYTSEQKTDTLLNKFIREMKFNCQPSIVPLIANKCVGIAEELARERAIGFAEWASDEGWRFEIDDLVGEMWYNKNQEPSEILTTDQLYSKYEEHLKKK